MAPMLSLLVRQDLRQRFAGNVLGVLWTVVVPLLQLLVFALVFVHLFRARVPGLDEAGYVASLALGMWPWFAFSEALARGASALTDAAGLLSKVALSTWDVVTARVISAFLIHGLGFVLVLLALGLWRGGIAFSLLPLTLPAWAGLFVLAWALAQGLAIGSVFARDVQQVLGPLLTAWMFLTPILYDMSLMPESWRPWLLLNPVAGLIHAIRAPLLLQDAAAAWPWPSLGFAALALALAWAMHRRFRAHVREFL